MRAPPRNYLILKEITRMPYTIEPRAQKPKRKKPETFIKLTKPLNDLLPNISPLEARGDRPLQMTFQDQLDALIYFHLEEHTSGRHLLQDLEEDDFAHNVIAPSEGIKKSSFFEAINTRGLEQLAEVFQGLYGKATHTLPKEYTDLGDLVSIDGSLVDAVLSMHWADYREGAKKAKVHLGFDLNHSIPSRIYLTDGKADERPFASKICSSGQTAVLDRYYQCHKNFDLWQTEGKHFVCRIKARTTKKIIRTLQLQPGSIVFYDAIALLGTPGVNQTEKEVRVVAFQIGLKNYWIATDRFDLSAEQIAAIYKLRWAIEVFFGWWKRHLKVYHLIARSWYGLMVQILAGLITYLLLDIYCHEQHHEKVSIKRVRELRNKIRNEASTLASIELWQQTFSNNRYSLYAIT